MQYQVSLSVFQTSPCEKNVLRRCCWVNSVSLDRLIAKSTFVLQEQTTAAHGPAILLINIQRIKILLRAAFLFNPVQTPVARAQDDAAAPDNPPLAFIDELDTQ